MASGKLSIGILYESREKILRKWDHLPEDVLYHWREPEEIDAVENALTHWGHGVSRIGDIDGILHAWKNGDLPQLVWNLSVDVVSRNRTALAPAVLEQLGVPYTGADASFKTLLLNKDHFKPLLKHWGVLTPEWKTLQHPDELDQHPPWKEFIVKPSCEGFSIGLKHFSREDPLDSVRDHISEVQSHLPCRMLIEEFIPGREITLSAIDGVEAIGAAELAFEETTLSDRTVAGLEAKRYGLLSRQPVPAADPMRLEGEAIVKRLMKNLYPLDYATFDFRISPEGAMHLIDINPDATLHPHRSFAQSFQLAGVDYAEIIRSILNRARCRWGL